MNNINTGIWDAKQVQFFLNQKLIDCQRLLTVSDLLYVKVRELVIFSNSDSVKIKISENPQYLNNLPFHTLQNPNS